MTPLELSICLHYHSSFVDAPFVTSHAPVVDEVFSKLVMHGLLIKERATTTHGHIQFQPTPKLHAFVAMLEATPLPVNAWLDPRTKVCV